jgi:hypothetical protein
VAHKSCFTNDDDDDDREEHRLRVFENRVLRRIFGLKRDDVMRCWRKLHNEMGRACSMHWRKEECI